jgi:hypothetical protein
VSGKLIRQFPSINSAYWIKKSPTTRIKKGKNEKFNREYIKIHTHTNREGLGLYRFTYSVQLSFVILFKKEKHFCDDMICVHVYRERGKEMGEEEKYQRSI